MKYPKYFGIQSLNEICARTMNQELLGHRGIQQHLKLSLTVGLHGAAVDQCEMSKDSFVLTHHCDEIGFDFRTACVHLGRDMAGDRSVRSRELSQFLGLVDTPPLSQSDMNLMCVGVKHSRYHRLVSPRFYKILAHDVSDPHSLKRAMSHF